MGPGMLRVGGGGGLAGNVYINGNVGIGTANPVARLDVNGSFKTSGTVEIARSVATPNTYIEMNSRYIDFHTGTTLIDYDSRIIADGGTGTTGQGNIFIFSSTCGVNSNTILLNGTVGIGTSSPTTTLDVSGVIKTSGGVAIGSGSEFQIEKSATSKTLLISHFSNPNTPICFYNKFPGGTTLVGIDTTTPATTLDVSGIITATGGITSASTVSVKTANGYIRMVPSYASGGADYTGYLEFLSPSGVRLAFLGNIPSVSNLGTGHMQMSFNNETRGLHLIGTATDSTNTTTGQLKLDGGCGIAKSLTVGGTITSSSTISASGYATRAGVSGGFGGNSFNYFWTGAALQVWIDAVNLGNMTYTSDYRIKQNVNLWSDSVLEKIKKIPIITFNYKNFSIFKEDNETHIGFLAHELQEQFPQTVTGEKDGVDGLGKPLIQTINVLPFTTILMKAIQEQQTQIEQLQNQNKSLEQRLSLLEQRLSC